MTYEDAVETTVSRRDAIREIDLHSLDPKDFFAEIGDKPEYKGAEILDWLGY